MTRILFTTWCFYRNRYRNNPYKVLSSGAYSLVHYRLSSRPGVFIATFIEIIPMQSYPVAHIVLSTTDYLHGLAFSMLQACG